MPDTDYGFISTGVLPPARETEHLLRDAYECFRDDCEGEVSTVYPALSLVDPELFGVCLITSDGRTIAAGDVDTEFPIMSVAKPMVFAIVCQAIGADEVRAKVGVNSTGRAFNSLAAIEASPDGRTNPMVNPGAIATTSLLPGDSYEQRWQQVQERISQFAGRQLSVMDDIYQSAMESNFRNRALTWALQGLGRIYSDPQEAIDLYTRICSLGVTARDLATIGATLADGGKNPVTGVTVVDQATCHYTLAVMVSAGMYETSGDWLYDIGLPGKSGIGGGIVTSAPGKGGLGTYSPRLDAAGNSVRGIRVAELLSRQLGLGLFFSHPVE